MAIFFNFYSHQIIFIHYNSRLVVDEDGYGKLRLERVNVHPPSTTLGKRVVFAGCRVMAQCRGSANVLCLLDEE